MPEHSCFAMVDSMLRDSRTRLSRDLFDPNKLLIATELTEKKRGARPLLMIATFCPFCGKRVAKKNAKKAAKKGRSRHAD